jgi:trehalose synthase
MRIRDTGDLWWKDAVFYCVDVDMYMDWDDDGVGDLEGLIQRIDHLSDLGVTCLWLMPFYPAGGVDDGYDVTDFYGVDPRSGSAGDLVALIRTARDRGIRVIVDLVVNHTSDRHPWFRSARSSPSSPFRDFYVWSEKEPPQDKGQVVFPDKEDGIWSFDDKAQLWYRHHFYRQQPDLNTANPRVRDELAKVIGFWSAVGVNGFRVDAVPYFLADAASWPGDEVEHRHDFLVELRSFLTRRVGDGILLGEVNLPYDQQVEFFGGPPERDGDELNVQFDFNLMQATYLAFARQDATPLAAALARRPEIPRDAQWATFLRNHDELTLDKLSDDERAEVFAAFGPEPEMQLYGRGLRRRLPPMLDGDPRRLRMAYSLLFAMPGSPVLFYGEEIGMGENLAAPGRMAVRTPMQWSAGRHGGFSGAPRSRLVAPLTEGSYGPEHVNVEAQRNDPGSLLGFMQLLIRRYRECPELAWAARVETLAQPETSVLALRSAWDDGEIVTLHNLGPDARSVPLELDGCGEDVRLVDLLEAGECAPDARGRVTVDLDGYGYRWLRVVRPGHRRLR